MHGVATGKLGRRALANKRIHITGTPRSGTTLFLSLMLACFDVDGGVTTERRLWRTPPANRRIVCTKFPDETDLSMQMLKFDPDLHVVFMLRDPRDVIVSKHHQAPEIYFTNLRVWRENLEAARPYFGHERVHVVMYNDLINDPDGMQVKLLQAMPFLGFTRPFSKFCDHAGEKGGAWLNSMEMKLRPVARDSSGLWRKHLARIKGQIALHGDMSDDLVELGFETDKSWLLALDQVDADLLAGAAPERTNFDKRVTRSWRNALGVLIYLARRYAGIELSDTGEARRPKVRETSVPVSVPISETEAIAG